MFNDLRLANPDVEDGFNLDLAYESLFYVCDKMPKLREIHNLEELFLKFIGFVFTQLKDGNFVYTSQGYKLISKLSAFTAQKVGEVLNLNEEQLSLSLNSLIVALNQVLITTDHGIIKVFSDYCLNEQGAFALELNEDLNWHQLFEYCFDKDAFKLEVLEQRTTYKLNYEVLLEHKAPNFAIMSTS